VNAAMFGREVDMLCLLIHTRCIVVCLLQIHISIFSEHILHSNEIQCNYHHVLPQLLFAEIEPCASSGLCHCFCGMMIIIIMLMMVIVVC